MSGGGTSSKMTIGQGRRLPEDGGISRPQFTDDMWIFTCRHPTQLCNTLGRCYHIPFTFIHFTHHCCRGADAPDMHSVLSHQAVRLQGPTFSSLAVSMFEARLGLPFSFSLLASSLPICSSTTNSDTAAL